jgi:hypothetical protein
MARTHIDFILLRVQRLGPHRVQFLLDIWNMKIIVAARRGISLKDHTLITVMIESKGVIYLQQALCKHPLIHTCLYSGMWPS